MLAELSWALKVKVMFKLFFGTFFGIFVSACAHTSKAPAEKILLCDKESYEIIERRLRTSDTYGHGPDIGSDEWKSVVEFKLGVRNEPFVPPKHTDAWCQFIQSVFINQPDNKKAN